MKRKKLLSTAVAGMLVAAQMVMPVMAAPHSVTVEVTTQSALIRLQVPTKFSVAVNEFEINDEGTQLSSNDFELKNLSSIPVYVKTVATVTPGANVTLVDTKAGAVAREDKKGNAWVALAAKTAAGSYGTIKDLTEASKNVATVVGSSTKTASQEFYLAAGEGAIQYGLVDATSGVPSTVPSYVGEFFPLTELTKETTSGAEAGADGTSTFNADDVTTPAKTNTEILQALAAAGDVYAVDGSDNISKVAANASYASTNTYYTPGTAEAVASGKKYVYAEQSAVASGSDTGVTAFRLIGKLSSGKQGGWTKDDFSGITLTYDITGVQASAYADLKKNCTYGLYAEPPANTAPSISTVTYTATSDNPVTIQVNLGSGNLKATGIASVTYENKSGAAVAVAADGYTFANNKVELTEATINAFMNATATTRKYTITFNDSAKTAIDITVSKTTD